MNCLRSMIPATPLIAIAAVTGLNSTSAFAWNDETSSQASQCSVVDINDAGTAIMNCTVQNAAKPFVTVGGVQSPLAALPSTTGGVPCRARAINNAAAGQETIIGSCADGQRVAQAVTWKTSAPQTAPTQLPPNKGLLGLGIIGEGVKTEATSVNLQGVTIGNSIDGNGTYLPVYWSASGQETALLAPLGRPQANCRPVKINDAQTNGRPTSSIVGNCPDGTGKNNPVVWTLPALTYNVLPTPSGASYCKATEINLAGQVIGECTYGAAVEHAVQWGPGGTGPTVLLSVDSDSAPQSSAADQNDAGQVVVNFLKQNSTTGYSEPALWNPTGGTVANRITFSDEILNATVLGIGNNGRMVGNVENAQGDSRSFHVAGGTLTAVVDAPPNGGDNNVVEAMSPSGNEEASTAENASGEEQADVETTTGN